MRREKGARIELARAMGLIWTEKSIAQVSREDDTKGKRALNFCERRAASDERRATSGERGVDGWAVSAGD